MPNLPPSPLSPLQTTPLALLAALLLLGAAHAGPCEDTAPPGGGFTCAQQKGWGKCSESWMVENGWCAATCGRCGGGNVTAPADATAPAAAPAAAAVQAAPSGSTAEYAKVRRMTGLRFAGVVPVADGE